MLSAEPNNAHAWHLSGVLAHQRGQHAQAANSIARAIALDPTNADFHDNLASVYQVLQRLSDAISSLREAVRLAPADARLLNKLGSLLVTAGQADQAAEVFRQLVRAHPGAAAAHANLGNTLAQLGKHEEAIESLRGALAIRPDFAEARFNLGNLLEGLGRLTEAQQAYEGVVTQQPNFARGHCRLGAVLHALGDLVRAQSELETSLRLDPTLAEAHAELADLARELGRMEAALAGYREALRLDPRSTKALNNLALALRAVRRYEDSAECCRRAIAIDPTCVEAHSNLGLALQDLERFDEAIACQRRALELRPDSSDLHQALGAVLACAGRYEDALRVMQTAIELGQAGGAPPENLAVVHNNRGGVLKQLGRYDEALASFEQGLQEDTRAAQARGEAVTISPETAAKAAPSALMRPERASLRNNRALTRLLLGDWAGGWPDFEWRWHVGQAVPRPPLPEWDGSPLEGRTILLYPEQGIGDTIQFIRYAPLVRQRGGKVLFACPPKLNGLLSTCPGIDRVVSEEGRLAGVDVQAALVSLPRLLGTDLNSIPADVPYLSADAAVVETWRERLQSAEGFRVGIAWQGNRTHAADRERSIPLAEFRPLAIPGVRLLSLQKGFGTEQLADAPFAVEDLGSQLDESGGAFRDTAAVIQNLDLVIVSDSAICHLAGALAAPVWVALPFSPDWRWLLERPDSPWYPTMRLFRQETPGDWGGVFARIAAELAGVVSRAAGTNSSG